jgi:hypothetical protein
VFAVVQETDGSLSVTDDYGRIHVDKAINGATDARREYSRNQRSIRAWIFFWQILSLQRGTDYRTALARRPEGHLFTIHLLVYEAQMKERPPGSASDPYPMLSYIQTYVRGATEKGVLAFAK